MGKRTGGKSRKRSRSRAGTCRGMGKSRGPAMLALLALPLLAVSARGQVEERSLLEDIIEDLERQHQYPDYQYSDQMYDAEPAAPARALHQDDLRAATRQWKQIKSSMLPAYCDPPNPCPHGYTSEDGCIEDFENNAEFSRQYQASQSCMCDTEHMFNCPDNRINNIFKKKEEPDLSYLEGIGPFAGFPEIENPYLTGHKLPI